jgi:hypothetical protein
LIDPPPAIEEIIWCDSEGEDIPQHHRHKFNENDTKKLLTATENDRTKYKTFNGMLAYVLKEAAFYIDGDIWNAGAGARHHDFCPIYLAMKVFPREVLSREQNNIQSLRTCCLTLLKAQYKQWCETYSLNDKYLMTLFKVSSITPQIELERFVDAHKEWTTMINTTQSDQPLQNIRSQGKNVIGSTLSQISPTHNIFYTLFFPSVNTQKPPKHVYTSKSPPDVVVFPDNEDDSNTNMIEHGNNSTDVVENGAKESAGSPDNIIVDVVEVDHSACDGQPRSTCTAPEPSMPNSHLVAKKRLIQPTLIDVMRKRKREITKKKAKICGKKPQQLQGSVVSRMEQQLRNTRMNCKEKPPKYFSDLNGVRIVDPYVPRCYIGDEEDDSSEEDISNEYYAKIHLPLELEERKLYYLELKQKKKRSKKLEDVQLVQMTYDWSIDVTPESYIAQPYGGSDKPRGNYEDLWLLAKQEARDRAERRETEPPKDAPIVEDNQSEDQIIVLIDGDESVTPPKNRRVIRRFRKPSPEITFDDSDVEQQQDENQVVNSKRVSRKSRTPRKEKSGGCMNFREAAIMLLTEAGGGPLSARDIAKAAIERGLIITKGKTPEATIASSIYTEIRSKPDSPFKHVGPGVFGIRLGEASEKNIQDVTVEYSPPPRKKARKIHRKSSTASA